MVQERYERNIPALTEAECHTLHSCRVLIAGCGGLGGHLADMAARIGFGSVRAIDGDVFEPSNLNRQLLCEVPLLGASKAAAAADHIARVNPSIEAEGIAEFITADNVSRLLKGCSAVFDALDNLPSRRLLAAACSSSGIPYIYGAVSGWVCQAAISMPGDGLIDRLFPEGTAIRGKSVLSFTTALCASLQMSLGVRLLTGRDVQTGTVLCFDLLHQEYEQIPLC